MWQMRHGEIKVFGLNAGEAGKSGIGTELGRGRGQQLAWRCSELEVCWTPMCRDQVGSWVYQSAFQGVQNLEI